MRLLAFAILASTLAAQETLTTLQDQRALAVTIYNDNLALVKDLREVRLAKGELALAFQDVSAQLRPETALLRNLTAGADFWVNEQNFDFDLLSPQKLLEKAVGGKVTVVSQVPNADGAGSRERREVAEVLATNGGVVLRFADRIETSPPGRIIFDQVPGQLRARPTLVLDLHSPADAVQQLELSYLTTGLSWRADYVMNLAPDATAMDLAGWVTLTNQSGTRYPHATLQLVAGDLNRVQPPQDRRFTLAARAEGARAPEMNEETLFEYHLYTLDRPATLKENQTKQVALLAARGVPVTKEYVLRGDPGPARAEPQDSQPRVAVFVAFDNRAEARLGLPLPRGIVRVYQRDRQGRPQFVGEDSVGHTPRNARVRLRLGSAFDVTARRRQTAFKVVRDGKAVETAWQIDLANARKEAVTVAVVETRAGDWELLEQSLPCTRETPATATFLVKVPGEGAATLTFRARCPR